MFHFFSPFARFVCISARPGSPRLGAARALNVSPRSVYPPFAFFLLRSFSRERRPSSTGPPPLAARSPRRAPRLSATRVYIGPAWWGFRQNDEQVKALACLLNPSRALARAWDGATVPDAGNGQGWTKGGGRGKGSTRSRTQRRGKPEKRVHRRVDAHVQEDLSKQKPGLSSSHVLRAKRKRCCCRKRRRRKREARQSDGGDRVRSWSVGFLVINPKKVTSSGLSSHTSACGRLPSPRIKIQVITVCLERVLGPERDTIERTRRRQERNVQAKQREKQSRGVSLGSADPLSRITRYP